MTVDVPNATIAGNLAAAAIGHLPVGVRRFSTGGRHYVFEAKFEGRAPVVVRIAAEHSRSAMVGAYKLSNLLRPQGVPLPEVIAEGAESSIFASCPRTLSGRRSVERYQGPFGRKLGSDRNEGSSSTEGHS